MALSTLLIPDITGFTKFVKTTEIEHSKHIIEELINGIIQNGSQLFELVEIEGDAVFFYKDQKLGIDSLEQLTKQIYLGFHSHLAQYEYGRICQCGACLQAIDLKLKFIVHSGSITLANFDGQKAKPYGDPVIAVHRLLKNDVDKEEYVLYSSDFLTGETYSSDGNGTRSDEELGAIPYEYKSVEEWKSDLGKVQNQEKSDKVDFEINDSRIFNLSIAELHHFVTELKYRSLWNTDVDKIDFDENEINQAGASHYCVVDGKTLLFKTVKPTHSEGLLTYGEILKDPQPPIKYLESNFAFVPTDHPDRTELQILLRISLKWRILLLISPLLKKKIRSQARNILDSIDNGLFEKSKIEG